MNKLAILIFIINFSLYINSNLFSQDTNILKNRFIITERDKLTSKINILTSWKYTYQYLKDSKFRFYKKYGKTITLDFSYKNLKPIFVNNGTPIIFTFSDGRSVQLTNIQNVVYNPYYIGAVKFYDVLVKYKFNNDSEFNSFANIAITNIRFNFINEFNERDYDDIEISTLKTSNWQIVFNYFQDGINKLEEIENNY